MALSLIKRRDYFLKIWYHLVIVHQITCVSSTNTKQRTFHREFCDKKNEIDQSSTNVKTSSLLNCARSCKNDCQAFRFYEEKDEKSCVMMKDAPALPKKMDEFDCQDPENNVSVYFKRKVERDQIDSIPGKIPEGCTDLPGKYLQHPERPIITTASCAEYVMQLPHMCVDNKYISTSCCKSCFRQKG